MNQDLWTRVDRYITDLLVGPDPVVDAALAASSAAGLPAISVSPPQGKQLMLLARMCRARNILEIGTLGGYSTIWLARGLVPNGHVVTLESEAKHADIARANFVRAGLVGVIELRVGRALDLLPLIAAEKREPFDLVFIDADKANIPAYFTWSLELTRAGSVIVVDNVVRDGALIDEASTVPDVLGVRRLNEMMAADPRVSATVIQTVGSKGYDGFALAVVGDSP